MFYAIKTTGISLKPTRCRLAYGELNFLGHEVSNNCLSLGPEKTRAVASIYVAI